MSIGLAFIFVAMSTIGYGRFVESLECYACDSVDKARICNNITHFLNDQACFTEVTNGVYRLGCVSNKHCGGLSSVVTSIVGLSAEVYVEDDVTNREVDHCFECCSSNVCNVQLCQQFKPTACIDDAKADCAWMNSKFNICHDVHLAKNMCPRFCGLCALVTPTVTFLSHDLASTSLSNNQVLVFTNVTFNAGNGYNKATGKFTAPLPGTYFFPLSFAWLVHLRIIYITHLY